MQLPSHASEVNMRQFLISSPKTFQFLFHFNPWKMEMEFLLSFPRRWLGWGVCAWPSSQGQGEEPSLECISAPPGPVTHPCAAAALQIKAAIIFC